MPRAQFIKPKSCKNWLSLEERTGAKFAPVFVLCAEHDRQLGGASPLHNQMEVK
jgi:hypothetical protein